MIFTTALVSLLLTVVIGDESACVRPSDDSVYELEADIPAVVKGYDEIKGEVENAIRENAGEIFLHMSEDDNCSTNVLSSDTVDAHVRQTILAPWPRTCEPCPPTVHFLHRFLKYCYIIQKPFQQWIRFVSCPWLCSDPCRCSNSRCVKTSYKFVWVWAYCTQDTKFGFKEGLNLRWLWLPQDCQCREIY